MKAVLFEQYAETPDVLRYTNVEEPEAGPGEIIVQIRASALNYNDIWGRRGRPVEVPLPHISGTDASGVVTAVGEGVTNVDVGDEIVVHAGHSCRTCQACTSGAEFFCRGFQLYGFQTGPMQGTHAELCRIQAAQAVAKPSNTNWEEAAALPLCLATAWRMLITRARISPGDTVLIWGAAGGLGVYALQIARLAGAIPIAVVGSERKASFVHDLGAQHVINRSEQDVVKEVRRITEKVGVDVVFEHPGEKTWPTSVAACSWGGTIVVCGATSGFDATTDLRYLWNKQQNHLGSHVANRAETERALAEVERGTIRPVVGEIMNLSEAARAQTLMEHGEVLGKIVFVPN